MMRKMQKLEIKTSSPSGRATVYYFCSIFAMMEDGMNPYSSRVSCAEATEIAPANEDGEDAAQG